MGEAIAMYLAGKFARSILYMFSLPYQRCWKPTHETVANKAALEPKDAYYRVASRGGEARSRLGPGDHLIPTVTTFGPYYKYHSIYSGHIGRHNPFLYVRPFLEIVFDYPLLWLLFELAAHFIYGSTRPLIGRGLKAVYGHFRLSKAFSVLLLRIYEDFIFFPVLDDSPLSALCASSEISVAASPW